MKKNEGRRSRDILPLNVQSVARGGGQQTGRSLVMVKPCRGENHLQDQESSEQAEYQQ